MKILTKIFLLLLSHSVWANSYKYRLTVRDASHLKEASDKNQWMLKFYDSVLYQGLVLRLAPVVFSMGEENNNEWKGRLIDFIFDSILKGHPISGSYFPLAGNKNPVGITVHEISDNEMKILKMLVLVFGNNNSDVVTKISYKDNTFGVQFHENCVSIARSLKVVQALAKEKCKIDLKSDATLTINLSVALSSFTPLLHHFVGVGDEIKLGLGWNSSRNAFEAKETFISLNEKNIFRTIKLSNEFLKAIPAHAGVWGLATLEDFISLNKKNLEKYFLTQGKIKSNLGVPVVLGYLGIDSRGRSKSFLMLSPPPKTTDQELAEIFNETSTYEVKFKKLCNGSIAFSPSEDALNDLMQVCQNKIAGFTELSENYASALKQKLTASFFLNPGTLIASALERGSTDAIKETDDYKTSYQLLRDLPHFLWTGEKQTKALVLKGVRP